MHRAYKPRWMSSIGYMRDSDVRVRALCRKCRVLLEVDLNVMCTMRGRSFSLINAKARCKIVGCGGEVFFMASPGEGTPFRPLAESAPKPRERPKPEPPDDDPGYPPPLKMGLSW